MTIYTFETINPKNLPAQPERTLGIEVTDAKLAALCGLGNIDPQHGEHRGARRDAGWDGTYEPFQSGDAACTYVARMPIPPDGTILTTSRPDVDSIAAMAVLVLRRAGLLPTGPVAGSLPLPQHEQDAFSRLALIADRDNFRPAAGAPRPRLPTVEQPWTADDSTSALDGSQRLSALGVICSPNRALGQTEYPLAERVALVAAWLLWGMPSQSEALSGVDDPRWLAFAFRGQEVWEAIASACGLDTTGPAPFARSLSWAMDSLQAAEFVAHEARLDLARAIHDGRMSITTYCRRCGDDAARMQCQGYSGGCDPVIAVVRGLHAGALGIGYSQADIVIAEQRDPRLPAHDGTEEWPEIPSRKLTIAWREPGLVRREALCAALNDAEIDYRASRGVGLARVPTGPAGSEDWRLAAREALGGTWGGPAALLGSPHGGTVLSLGRVVALVREHIA